MAYKSGTLKVWTGPQSKNYDDPNYDWTYPNDLSDYGPNVGTDRMVHAPAVYLPHSCDEWVIGGKEAVEAMILDLLEVLHGL